ncbi:MAG: YggT family protein [Chloroflexota bacterium]
MAALASVIELLIGLYSLTIIARVFTDWMRLDPYHPAARFLYQITEPLLAPLRARIPPVGMVDVSPMVALLLLWVLERVLIVLLI